MATNDQHVTGATISWTPVEATAWVFPGEAYTYVTWDAVAPADDTPKTPHPRFREYLESATRKLGPERCEQALRSFDGRANQGWQNCALASAYGEDGEFARLSDSTNDSSYEATAARVLGLSFREVICVIKCFDGDYGKLPRELLHAMLTLEAAKMIPSPVVPAVMEPVS